MVFFTADEHFDHRNIINFCHRPFSSVEEMRERIIVKHNARVGPGDLVYHLGDMFWRTLTEAEALSIMDRLNGQHFYVSGNHEEALERSEKLRSRFIWIRDLAKIEPPGCPKIVLCHYAMRVWDGSHRGNWHLYGHTHAELPEKSLACDVGVDSWDYAPVSIEQIADKMRAKIAAGVVNENQVLFGRNNWTAPVVEEMRPNA